MRFSALLIVFILSPFVLASCGQIAQSDPSIAASELPLSSLSAVAQQPQAIARRIQSTTNVALSGVSRATAGEESAQFAIDGDLETLWNAQRFPTQWISVELDQLYLLDKVELVVAQTPAGPTSHEIWLLDDSGVRTLYRAFNGLYTEDGQIIEVLFDSPRAASEILVLTRENPSWVAWREVRIFGMPSANLAGAPNVRTPY